jgi:hypothetical protein
MSGMEEIMYKNNFYANLYNLTFKNSIYLKNNITNNITKFTRNFIKKKKKAKSKLQLPSFNLLLGTGL